MLRKIQNFMPSIVIICEIPAFFLILGLMTKEFGVILGAILTLVFLPIVALVVPVYEILINDFWLTAALMYIPLAAALIVAILIYLFDSSDSQ